MCALYIDPMNVTRHFSDTRTGEGRVRFLLQWGQVRLLAEGPGWQHESVHLSLEDAGLYLATLTQIPYSLYAQALDDLEQQAQFYGAA